MKHRIIIETLPHAHVRVTMHWFAVWLGDENDPRSEWRPRDRWSEDEVRALLAASKCGYDPTNLAWFKRTAPGVWEFQLQPPTNETA